MKLHLVILNTIWITIEFRKTDTFMMIMTREYR